jgi:uncharacterized protein YukE
MRRQAATVSLMFATIFALSARADAQGQAAPTQASSINQTQASGSDPQLAPSLPSATTVAPDSATPSKRVWTNDDVKDLRRDSAISTVGPAKARPQKAVPTNLPVANPATIKSYHDRIVALQDKLPPIDSQIADLQGVLNGQTVNSTRHTGAKIDDWHDELTRLQQQKSDLETKISAMQDEARHKGVPENQIPE